MKEPKSGTAQAVPVQATARKKLKRISALERYGSVLLTAVILLIWQVSVPLLGLSEFVLPTPWSIGERMVKDAELLALHASFTLLEVLVGFAAAVVLGVPLALAIF